MAAALLLASGRAPTPAELRAALQEAPSSAVAVQALYLPAPQAGAAPAGHRVRAWLARRRDRSVGPLMCGVAQGETGSLWLVASAAGRLEVTGRDPVMAGGSVAPGFSRPELVVAYLDGELARIRLSADALRSGVVIARGGRRVERVQLVAFGPEGPMPVAQRALLPPIETPSSEGGAPKTQTQVPSRAGEAARRHADAERRGERVSSSLAWSVAGELNALRRAHGVAPLRRHRLLRGLAARHAHHVCRSGKVAHQLAAGADPEDRIARAGLQVQRVGEAIARVGAPEQAFAALARSPSHLRTLTLRRFSDAGVGVARGPRGQVCVVVLLALWPRYVPSPSAASVVGARSRDHGADGTPFHIRWNAIGATFTAPSRIELAAAHR